MFKFLTELSPEVQSIIFGEEVYQNNQKIADQFALNQAQLDFVLDLEEKIWLKQIDILDLPKELEKMERAEHYDLRALSLELAYQIFWPLQEYLEKVDRLILRLGGKVPRIQHLQSVASNRQNQQVLPKILKGIVKILLEQYPELKDYRLSSKKIKSKDGHSLSPTISNWIDDYVHFLGAGYHDSLQRSKYLAKSPNVLDLAPGDLESIRHFFTSYDDNVLIEINTEDVIAKISLVNNVEKKPVATEKKEISLEQLVKDLYQKFPEIEQNLLSTSVILSEAENSLHKLRDILWQALALQDQEKVISCLKVMLEKKALDLMLAEDKRFQGLLRRFVGIRYGDQVTWNIQDKLLVKRIFFELIFSDKLKMSASRAALTAFYLNNLTKKSGPVVYLDQASGILKWRELELVNKQLTWLNSI